MRHLVCLYFVAVWLICNRQSASAATQCAVKVPVPDRSYCDAIGTMEEHVEADIHHTRGQVSAVQDYLFDAFKLLDGEITAVVEGSTSTDENIRDVEEEILTMKRFVTNLYSLEFETKEPDMNEAENEPVNSEKPEVGNSRQKRAAPSTANVIQVVNAIKANFQQSLVSVLQKLQTISTSIANDVTKDAALHNKLLQELATNQQKLTATEQQLKALDSAVRNAMNSSKTGVSGVDLSVATQDVTDLIINATVSEQITQRQLDDLEKVVNQLEVEERRTGNKLATLTTDINDLDKQVNNATKETSTLQGAEKFYERKMDGFFQDTTRDVTSMTSDLASAQQSLAKVRRDIFNTTLTIGTYEPKLTAYRKSIDGVQSLVTFTQPVQQAEIANILNLKKTLQDNINVLKYAFGVTNTPP